MNTWRSRWWARASSSLGACTSRSGRAESSWPCILIRLPKYECRNPCRGAPGETRTPDLLVRSQPLYPPELRARAHHDSSSPYPSATTGFTSSAEPIGQAWIRDGCASYINAYEEYHGNGTSMAGLN